MSCSYGLRRNACLDRSGALRRRSACLGLGAFATLGFLADFLSTLARELGFPSAVTDALDVASSTVAQLAAAASSLQQEYLGPMAVTALVLVPALIIWRYTDRMGMW
jgi:hypothetical protein